MSKVTVRSGAAVETPSQAVTKAANAVVHEKDALGRLLGVKRLGPLQRLALFKALGDLSSNDRYLGVVALAACCVEIDGEPVKFPHSVLTAEALVDRLGDEGATCIAKIMQEHFSVSESGDESVAEAKNS